MHARQHPRRRRHGDLSACVSVLRLVHDEVGYPLRWPSDPEGWLDPPQLLSAWVLVEASTVVGHVALVAVTDDRASRTGAAALGRKPAALVSVSRLFVDPAHARKGHGHALLATARNEAVALGRVPVLDVVDDGKPAVQVYERLGWRRVATHPWDVVDGRALDLHYYVAPGD